MSILDEDGVKNLGEGFMPGELGASKVKLSTVIDQADDSEIRPLTVADLRVLLGHWKTNRNGGEEPRRSRRPQGIR